MVILTAQGWNTVRVFISSTFRDMHAERDYLVRMVFPELRERCAKRRLHLVNVDLRWGVTEEEAGLDQRAIPICVDEIARCHQGRRFASDCGSAAGRARFRSGPAMNGLTSMRPSQPCKSLVARGGGP